jgi:hypothetical protein
MVSSLQNFALRISRTWWLYLVVVFLAFGSLRALMVIGELFPPQAGGSPPFDLQNELSALQVYPQVAAYTVKARELYYAFTLIDYAFPFFAGLFIVATIAFALRHSLPSWYDWLVARKLLPVFMLGSAFDWLENITAVTIINLYPTEVAWLPGLLVLAKRCKLALTIVAQAFMVLVLLLAAGKWLVRKVRGT